MNNIKEILESKGYVCDRVFSVNRFNASLIRCENLIKEAIERKQYPSEYRFLEKQYNQKLAWPSDSHMKFSIYEDIGVIVISGCIEKSNSYAPHAIIPIGDIDVACDLFVHIVSRGEVKINWELFLDLET